MVYQLLRPSIETVIDYCGDLLADEKLEVCQNTTHPRVCGL